MGTAWAMSANQGAGDTGSAMGFIPMMVVMFVVMYFFILRPQQKKQKEAREMMDNLKKGDKVTTSGGIIGTVLNVKDDVVLLKVSENTKIEFRKAAIAGILGNEASEK